MFAAVLTAVPAQAASAPAQAQVRQVSSATVSGAFTSAGVQTVADTSARTTSHQAAAQQSHPTKKAKKKKKKSFFKKAGKFIFAIIGIIVVAIIIFFVWRALKRRN
ncbi:hypothetical protein [Embleya sp. NPDC020886]|uniref:hypothetical protein n=1 Tax=Embleya sp. NPDC020886 TaxID=3363980 RepID=UPI0037AE8933